MIHTMFSFIPCRWQYQYYKKTPVDVEDETDGSGHYLLEIVGLMSESLISMMTSLILKLEFLGYIFSALITIIFEKLYNIET